MGVNTTLLWLFCAVVAFNIVQCKTITRSQDGPIETTPDNNKQRDVEESPPETEGAAPAWEYILHPTDYDMLMGMNTRQKRSMTNTTVSNGFCAQSLGQTKCKNSPISCVYDGKGFVKHPNVTYRVVNEPRNGSLTGLSKSLVEGLTARALDAWAPHCGLHFTRRDHGPADIMISFEHGDHGDTSPFRSKSTVIAHTLGMPYNYHIHLNDAGSDEYLAQDYRDKKIYFYLLILHEVGHALGLDHSPEQDAVMYETHNNETKELHINDINCMRAFYGLEIIREGEWRNFGHLSEIANNKLPIFMAIYRVSLMFDLINN